MDGFDARDEESVVRDLQSSDEEVRRLAVERIDVLETQARIPLLVDRLGDPDWRVRKAAVSRIVAQPDPGPAVELLLRSLADGENPGRRNSAVEALVALGGTVVPALIEACGDADADVRKFVVDSLAGIGDERAVPRLLEAIGEPDANVRAAAADALGAIGGSEASRALVRIATEAGEDPLVRFSALHALDTLEVPVRTDELSGVLGDPVLGPAALALLGRSESDPGAAEALLKGLTSRVRAARESAMRGSLRWIARHEAAAIDDFVARLREAAQGSPQLVESAVARLGDAELGTRLALIQFLGVTHDARAVIPILEACRDEALAQVALATLADMDCVQTLDAAWDELAVEERRHACAALGSRRGPMTGARLIAALEDTDPEVRSAAATALGGFDDRSAVAPLVQRLQQIGPAPDLEGESEREALVEALCRLAGPDAVGRSRPWASEAVERLEAVLIEGADPVRLSAAQVLGRIARPVDADLVRLLLKDPVAEIRRTAVGAIARIEPQRAPEPLHLAIADESPEVRIAAARALAASGVASVLEDLRCLCGDDDVRVRAAAVCAVGTRFAGDPDPALRAEALALLNRACEDEVPVALAVVDAVSEIGGETSSYLAPLLQRSEPEVVLEAVRCFGRNAEATELDGLQHLISHSEWSVRAEVIEVLTERRVRRAVPAILRRLETEQDDFVRRAILAALAQLED